MNEGTLEERKSAMQTKVMLTTTDNPFSPFTQWDSWFAYDTQLGYHTCSYLARIVTTSPDLSEADQHLAIEIGIDEIVLENVLNVYIKVTEDDFKSQAPTETT